jgi:hypothetical protein
LRCKINNQHPQAPVVIFAFNRPIHLDRTLKALKLNFLSDKTEIFIFIDGPRNKCDIELVDAVRKRARLQGGFKSITIFEQEKNVGLAKSIINGVSKITNEYGKAIILEDDMITSPYFLSYMNEGLNKYFDEESVISIHGYLPDVRQNLPETFFLKGADCWGWGTWKDRWSKFNPDGAYLLRELRHRNLLRDFDLNGACRYSDMLIDQIEGRNNSWAIRWHASAFLVGGLTLHPGRSLVSNIGNDNSGTHCYDTILYDVKLTNTPVNLMDIPIEASYLGERAFENFYKGAKRSFLKSLFNFFRKLNN